MLGCFVPILLCATLALLVWRERVVQQSWTHYRLRVGREGDQAALEGAISELLTTHGGGCVWTVAEAATDLALVISMPGKVEKVDDLKPSILHPLNETPLHLARLRTMQLPPSGTWCSIMSTDAAPDWRGTALATVTRVTATGRRRTWALDAAPASSWRRGIMRLPVGWTTLVTTFARLTARQSETPLLPALATTRGMQIPLLPPCARTLPLLPGPQLALGVQQNGTALGLPLDVALRLQLVGTAERTTQVLGAFLTTMVDTGAAGLALLTPQQADTWLHALTDAQRARVHVLDSRVWGTTASLDLRVLPDPVLSTLLGDLAGLDGADSARSLLPSVIRVWRSLPQGQVTDLVALLCDPPQHVCAEAGYSALERRLVGLRWAERMVPLVTRSLLGLLAQPGIICGDVWQAGGMLVIIVPESQAERVAWGQLARALLHTHVTVVERPLLLIDGAALVPDAMTLPIGQIRVTGAGERMDGWWTLLVGGCSPSKAAVSLGTQGLHPLSIAFLPYGEQVVLLPDPHGAIHLTHDAREPSPHPECLTRHAGTHEGADRHLLWASQQFLMSVHALRQRMPLALPTSLTATSDTPDALTVTAMWDDPVPPSLPAMVMEQLAVARQCVPVRATSLAVTLPYPDTVPLRIPVLSQAGTDGAVLHAVPWESLQVALLGGAAWADTAAAVIGQLLHTTDPDRVRLHLLGTLPESLTPLTTAPHLTATPAADTTVGQLRQLLTAQVEPDADVRTPLVVLVLDDAAIADRLLVPTVRQALERSATKPFWLLLLAPVTDTRLQPLLSLVPLIGGTPGAMRMRRPGQASRSLPCACEQPLTQVVAAVPPRHHLQVAVLDDAAPFWGKEDDADLAPSIEQLAQPDPALGDVMKKVATAKIGAIMAPPSPAPASWTWTPEVVRSLVRDALENTGGRRQLRFSVVVEIWESMSTPMTKPTEADFVVLLDRLDDLVESRPNPKTAYMTKTLSDAEVWAVVDALYPAHARAEEVIA